MAVSIFEALNEIQGKVQSGELEIVNDNPGMPGMQGGTVAKANRMAPEADTMRGKKFVYNDGASRGIHEEVEYTVEMNGKYYVIFKSGVQMLVENLNITMSQVEDFRKAVKKVDGLGFDDEPEFSDIRPSRGRGRSVDKTAGLEMEDLPPVYADSEPLPEGFEAIGGGATPRRVAQEAPLSNNPIIALLTKMKKSPKTIRLELTLNIPSKSMYKMLTENFDGSEEAIIEFLTTGKNLKEFKECLKDALIKFYKEPLKAGSKTDKDNTIK